MCSDRSGGKCRNELPPLQRAPSPTANRGGAPRRHLHGTRSRRPRVLLSRPESCGTTLNLETRGRHEQNTHPGRSTVVRDKQRDSNPVVAMALINRMTGASPTGGPWVSEICRDPDPRYAGLGASLLRRVMVQLADDGESSLSLVVTEGNPARQLYERLGFRYVKSFRKLSIPALARDSAR